MGVCLEIVLPKDLLEQLHKYKSENTDAFQKQISTVFVDELKPQIDYIITLGGDGTLLWAAKQFNTCRIPPMITFA